MAVTFQISQDGSRTPKDPVRNLGMPQVASLVVETKYFAYIGTIIDLSFPVSVYIANCRTTDPGFCENLPADRTIGVQTINCSLPGIEERFHLSITINICNDSTSEVVQIVFKIGFPEEGPFFINAIDYPSICRYHNL